ncbi:MAG: PHP-associated domain-containing protein [Bryobacteraceae bacterium]
MKTLRWIAAGLLVASAAAGTIGDARPARPRPILGGYHVMATDFHVHSFPLSWATLSPWDTAMEAQRQGLDAIAIVGHNHVWVSKVGRWFSRMAGGPLVITGEEIVSAHYHLLAIGIDSTVDWRQTAKSAIDQIHRQRGVAIAAHPLAASWAAYDGGARRALDGAEVLHPMVYGREDLAAQLRQFYDSAPLTAIGDSDYHGLGPIGLCRTYVFTKEETQPGILDAIRHGRTLVYDGAGHIYGDTALIRLAAADGRLARIVGTPAAGFLDLFSRIAGVLGLTASGIAGLVTKEGFRL